MIVLYTKENCGACDRVKIHLELKNYPVEIKKEEQNYSKTYPCLVGDTWFMSNSYEIIKYLDRLKW